MDHDAVFEFEVLALKHLKAALTVAEIAQTSSCCTRHLVRLDVATCCAIFSCIVSLIMTADRRIQMLVRCCILVCSS